MEETDKIYFKNVYFKKKLLRRREILNPRAASRSYRSIFLYHIHRCRRFIDPVLARSIMIVYINNNVLTTTVDLVHILGS